MRRLPAKVIDELKLLYTLLFALVVDLRNDWLCEVFASDGAQSYGYGGCHCTLPPTAVRAAAAAAAPAAHRVIFGEARGGDSAQSFDTETHVLPCRMRDFVSDFSIKSCSQFHSTRLEVGAAALMLRAISRKPYRHGKRILLLTDSTAVLYGFRKGRSSAPNMGRGLRQAAALVLACDLKVHAAYVPSKWNPADLESRGHTRTRSTIHKSAPPSSLPGKLHALSRSVRRCVRRLRATGMLKEAHLTSRWNSSCSSIRLGQPSSDGW